MDLIVKRIILPTWETTALTDVDGGTSSHEECKQNNGGRGRSGGFELGKDLFSFVRELRDLILLINFRSLIVNLACDERFMLRGSSFSAN